jgi:hypothetical protein
VEPARVPRVLGKALQVEWETAQCLLWRDVKGVWQGEELVQQEQEQELEVQRALQKVP